MVEKIEELRNKLREAEVLTRELHLLGVTLIFTVGSEHKIIDIKSSSTIEITVKASINQEL